MESVPRKRAWARSLVLAVPSRSRRGAHEGSSEANRLRYETISSTCFAYFPFFFPPFEHATRRLNRYFLFVVTLRVYACVCFLFSFFFHFFYILVLLAWFTSTFSGNNRLHLNTKRYSARDRSSLLLYFFSSRFS